MMRINEILLESPQDIKLMIAIMGFDINEISIKSAQIKNKFLTDPSNQRYLLGMAHYLTQLNMILLEIANLPNWAEWIKTEDGITVQSEISDIYYDNMLFMKKYN